MGNRLGLDITKQGQNDYSKETKVTKRQVKSKWIDEPVSFLSFVSTPQKSLGALDHMPIDLIKEILWKLVAKDLAVLCRVSKGFHVVCSDENLWRHLFECAQWTDQSGEGSWKIKFFRMLRSTEERLIFSTQQYDFLVKCILIGSAKTGKSKMSQWICSKTYTLSDSYIPTIGVEFATATFLEKQTQKGVKLQIWDTAGEERFRSITRSYYRGSQVLVYVYDVTNRFSFEQLESFRTPHDYGNAYVIVILGNKCDMKEKREVLTEEGQAVAQRWNCLFFEVSVKTGYNLGFAFNTILSNTVTSLKAIAPESIKCD